MIDNNKKMDNMQIPQFLCFLTKHEQENFTSVDYRRFQAQVSYTIRHHIKISNLLTSPLVIFRISCMGLS